MIQNFIWIKNKRYNYYDTYSTYQKALAIAKWQYKRNKSKYFILTSEGGFFSPRKRYHLYLTRVIKFGW